jgi:hypothetical protein
MLASGRQDSKNDEMTLELFGLIKPLAAIN